MRPFGYFRGALHRRLFVWFGIAIALTAAVVMMVVALLGTSGQMPIYGRARTFLADQFAAVWDEPGRRDALGQAVAREFAVQVELSDPAGHLLATYGGPCRKVNMEGSVRRGGEALGVVRICDNHRFFPRFLAPLAVAVVVLWGVSGAVARRLVRPLAELTRVAGDLGRGHLHSRAHISRRHGREFSLVGNVMNEMASRIEKQLADQKALLATVSHEIRSPLARMRLLIELARGHWSAAKAVKAAGSGPPDQDELDQLEREIADIDALVSDLLASSRVDFRAITKTRLEASEIARIVLERASIDPSHLALPEQPVPFEGDATLVTRAVTNLVDNARRHGGGLETLRVEARPGLVTFVALDRGKGFAPGEERHIFEPFYRRASPDAAGAGLGLALVKKIAEAHGGQVFAANRSEGGARVAIEFLR
jgi:signal transduction histidine kinase